MFSTHELEMARRGGSLRGSRLSCLQESHRLRHLLRLDALVVQEEHHVVHCSTGVIMVCLYAVTSAEEWIQCALERENLYASLAPWHVDAHVCLSWLYAGATDAAS